MARCYYCETTILFGGLRDGDKRYCNKKCLEKGRLIVAGNAIPADAVFKYVSQVRSGPCPQCQGSGPNDVRTAHRVWSALLMTSWSSRPTICCAKCGVKNKIGNMLFSIVFGWWSIPWGLIVTPVIIIRNFIGFAQDKDRDQPSKKMEKVLRVAMVSQVIQAPAVRAAPSL